MCGIWLEVAEMEADDLLDVDVGGMVSKDEEDPIAVVGGNRWAEVREISWTQLRALSTTVLGLLRKKVDILGSPCRSRHHWNICDGDGGFGRMGWSLCRKQGVRMYSPASCGSWWVYGECWWPAYPRNGNKDVEEEEGGVRDEPSK
eukprot:g46606.t1